MKPTWGDEEGRERGEDLSTSLSRSASLTSARKLLRSWSSSTADDPMKMVEGTNRGGGRRARGRAEGRSARLGLALVRGWDGEDDERDGSVLLASRGEGLDGNPG